MRIYIYRNMSVSGKSIVVLILLLISIVIMILLMANQTTPLRVKQQMILGTIRNCIWYGYDENHAFDEADGQKSKIVLPNSLAVLKPTLKFDLRELNAFNKDCNLLYNPKGYEEKTWILTFISKDIETLIEGNLTLWSDKTITRKHNMKNVAQKTKGIKCYYCPDAKISE